MGFMRSHPSVSILFLACSSRRLRTRASFSLRRRRRGHWPRSRGYTRAASRREAGPRARLVLTYPRRLRRGTSHPPPALRAPCAWAGREPAAWPARVRAEGIVSQGAHWEGGEGGARRTLRGGASSSSSSLSLGGIMPAFAFCLPTPPSSDSSSESLGGIMPALALCPPRPRPLGTSSSSEPDSSST